jgi:hypothetical protein
MSSENKSADKSQESRREAWRRLRGIAKDIYAEYGGGEAYLRREREIFNHDMERRGAQIEEAMSCSTEKKEVSKHET